MNSALEQTTYEDDAVDYRALQGVRTRRIFAFLFDFAVISLLSVLGAVFVFFLGILTFGLAFGLYAILVPAIALVYSGTTLSAPEHATIGMRITGLTMRMKGGGAPDFITGAIHAVLFYLSVSILTPFVLLFALINGEKRLLHDILLGTVVIRAD